MQSSKIHGSYSHTAPVNWTLKNVGECDGFQLSGFVWSLSKTGHPKVSGMKKPSAKQRDAHIMPLPMGYPPAKLIRHLAESLTSSHSIHHTQKCPVDGHRRHRFFPVTPLVTCSVSRNATYYMPWKKVGKTGDASSLNELVSRFLRVSTNFKVQQKPSETSQQLSVLFCPSRFFWSHEFVWLVLIFFLRT